MKSYKLTFDQREGWNPCWAVYERKGLFKWEKILESESAIEIGKDLLVLQLQIELDSMDSREAQTELLKRVADLEEKVDSYKRASGEK